MITEQRCLTTKQGTPSTGCICHNSTQATSYFQKASGRRGGCRGNQPPEAGEDVTCPAGMDSKESEQPRAMGRSSGVRLSVDERLLARASSCTNMIPGRRGQAGQGKQPFNNWGWDLGLLAWLGASQTPKPSPMDYRRKS